MKYAIRKSVPVIIFLLLCSQLFANTSGVVSVWGKQEILASHVNYLVGENTNKSDINAVPINMNVLFESGEKHVTVIDGNKLEPVIRFPVRSALHGKPMYDSTGRFVYLSSSDGY